MISYRYSVIEKDVCILVIGIIPIHHRKMFVIGKRYAVRLDDCVRDPRTSF